MLALRPEDIDKVAAAGPGASGPGAPAAAAAAPAAVAAPAAAAAAAAAPAAASAAPAEGRVTASPFAKKLADDLGVDLAFVTGTGPDGRVQAEDVEAAAASGSAPAPAYVSSVVSCDASCAQHLHLPPPIAPFHPQPSTPTPTLAAPPPPGEHDAVCAQAGQVQGCQA